MLNLSVLNPQQREAVETLKGPVLILAGAGTGKTRVITFRIAHMIAQGIAPDHILAVTFTNKAAREMKERVRKLVPKKAKKEGEEKAASPTISTFHSLGVRLLKEHIEKLGYKRNFVIYDESEQLGLIKRILSHFSGEKVDAKEVQAMISRIKSAGLKNVSARQEKSAFLAQHFLSRYESGLRACNAVDFDDLLNLSLKLLNEFPEVLESCRARYRYIMVDEYQDTNGAQFELINLLAGQHRNLCVVGDDDQSIYGWRGAEIANLMDLEKHYPEVKIIKLEQNYRSTNMILNAANAVIKNNARRRGKQLWSAEGDGNKILLHTFKDDTEEAKTIAEKINFEVVANRIPWGDQAILFRTNLQSRALETGLRQAGIRYHLIGGQSYFDRREIKDFVAYLKIMVNPDDDISLLRIANVPARGLSDTTMERLLGASHQRQTSVYRTMYHTDVIGSFLNKTSEAITSFARWIDATRAPLMAKPDLSLRQWAENFLLESGYLQALRDSEKNPEVADSRIANIKDLIGTMEENPLLPAMDRLETFLEELMLDNDRRDEKDKEKKGDSVTLITMHSCKGLEFPHVHVVGLEDGLLPHTRSKEEGTLDEERRLFYVAITRAMKGLTISYCLGRQKYGQVVPCHPSPFLKELPKDCIINANEQGKAAVSVETGKSRFDMMRSMIEKT